MATVLISERVNKNNKSFVVYFRDPLSGKRKYYKTFKMRKDAAAEAARLRVMLDGREYAELAKIQKRHTPLTFNEVADLCRKEWDRRVATGELSSVTGEDYKIALRQLCRTFGDNLLMDITREMILEYRAQVAMDLSVITSNRRLFIFKQVLKRAYAESAVVEDVAAPINYLSEKKHERNKYLKPEKLDELLKACCKTKAKHYLVSMILLGAEHGCSKQEVLDLKWKDIDFDTDTIRFFRTKNGMERTMWLMPRTKYALLHWKKHVEYARHRRKIVPKDDSWVYGHLDGTPRSNFRSAWEKVRLLAGLKGFHFHDLRHTFASNLLTSGGDLKDVKVLLGHRDIRSTDRYAHLSGLRKQDRQVKLAGHYGQWMPSSENKGGLSDFGT
ncbi:tyrosine-type recombinase/integrase [Desulfoplanes formicivorans]|uniref:Integrase n=1 Tax=Desulfoplanes formicivorans TaxID=1592317 RepID=A0A194AJZ3_9BACT|nr:site-specific integrase [Desulfoplanes formicivorans]GAU09565.1 integrase [Desulfoplanes formicivorans]